MIPGYRRILYTTDLSSNSALAFRHAVSLARVYDAEINILHVMPALDSAMENYLAAAMGEEAFAALEDRNREELTVTIRQRLERFAAEELNDHPEDLKRVVGIEVHYGRPAATILAAADRLDPDLIVCGTHGKGLVEHTFLGSVAEKVLRKSVRPVLVVPIGRRREEEASR
ncbi:nucleotide-binding universal stress UspA family protein [Geothermobacter ehrlichii]|uniref:Nucleotide-binding universal stress UspA family protein n=1 Tax=Geothermobacter ehrlichii TaxID=213224 RepID=A0A5D3WJ21_9BACT|nr:universal stress protein [Geothermobacter ehrlichii]TYO98500.1 nucleotide-binding universal stress UspA family protein [Geothermobacter ehrlichii]